MVKSVNSEHMRESILKGLKDFGELFEDDLRRAQVVEQIDLHEALAEDIPDKVVQRMTSHVAHRASKAHKATKYSNPVTPVQQPFVKYKQKQARKAKGSASQNGRENGKSVHVKPVIKSEFKDDLTQTATIGIVTTIESFKHMRGQRNKENMGKNDQPN